MWPNLFMLNSVHCTPSASLRGHRLNGCIATPAAKTQAILDKRLQGPTHSLSIRTFLEAKLFQHAIQLIEEGLRIAL